VGRRPAFLLTRASYFLPAVSNTFHGRDVFAPVAAHIARGVPLDRFGPPKRRIIELRWPRPRRTTRGLIAEIVSIDRFGNLITNLEPDDWASLRRPRLSAGSFSASTLSTSYADVTRGAVAIVFGGYGLLEIAARDASAARVLDLAVGNRVRLEAR
jgi:S-adenosylmethionine hydrolase